MNANMRQAVADLLSSIPYFAHLDALVLSAIGLLPPPQRLPNGYRQYSETDVDRVKFVAASRGLDFSLDDIGEILDLRDRREAPCRTVLDLLQQRAEEISQRIVDLQRLETELRELHRLGLTFPTDDVDGKECVCHLITRRSDENAID